MVTSVVGQKMSKETKNERQTMSFCYQPQELYPGLQISAKNRQRKDCKLHPAAFKYSLIGLKRAEEECKRLLIKHTWNCTGLISQTQKSLERNDRTSIMSESKSKSSLTTLAGMNIVQANSLITVKLTSSSLFFDE